MCKWEYIDGDCGPEMDHVFARLNVCANGENCEEVPDIIDDRFIFRSAQASWRTSNVDPNHYVVHASQVVESELELDPKFFLVEIGNEQVYEGMTTSRVCPMCTGRLLNPIVPIQNAPPDWQLARTPARRRGSDRGSQGGSP